MGKTKQPEEKLVQAGTKIDQSTDAIVRELTALAHGNRAAVLRAMIRAGSRDPRRVRKLLEEDSTITAKVSSTGRSKSDRNTLKSDGNTLKSDGNIVESHWTDEGIERAVELAKVIPFVAAAALALAGGEARAATPLAEPAPVVVLSEIAESEGRRPKKHRVRIPRNSTPSAPPDPTSAQLGVGGGR